VNDEDSTSPGRVEIPDHLLPALGAVAELELEMACDGQWDAKQRDRVVAAVRALDALVAGTCTCEQIAELAARAAAMQGEGMRSDAENSAAAIPVTLEAAWPVTVEAANVLSARARLTCALIELRDVARGSAASEADVRGG
jgi:hypothetical protein